MIPIAFLVGKYEYILAGKRSIETGWLLFQLIPFLGVYHDFLKELKLSIRPTGLL